MLGLHLLTGKSNLQKNAAGQKIKGSLDKSEYGSITVVVCSHCLYVVRTLLTSEDSLLPHIGAAI